HGCLADHHASRSPLETVGPRAEGVEAEQVRLDRTPALRFSAGVFGVVVGIAGDEAQVQWGPPLEPFGDLGRTFHEGLRHTWPDHVARERPQVADALGTRVGHSGLARSE